MKTANKITVNAESTGARLDVFLSEELDITRSKIQKLIEEDLVLLNDKLPRKAGDRIKEGDVIICHCEERDTSDEAIPTNGKPTHKKSRGEEIASVAALPRNDIKIITEAPDYIVVDKPTGMLSHSTMKNEEDSLAELLLKKYPELKKVGDDPQRPGIVHRLDKEASGLLVIARTPDMFDHLKTQFKMRAIDKEYLVLVHGKVAKDWSEINFPIARSKTSERMAAIPGTSPSLAPTEIEEGAKKALTEFTVEKRYVNFTLLRVKIHTGRMHQIRAHMLAYNHPVVGDPLYFQKKQKRTWDNKLGRLFLHCTKLVFTDLSGVLQEFESPLPKQLAEFLTKLK